MHVHVWQMYLRLSAWPSSSISPDRALTAVQRPLSMCRQTVNPVEVLSDNPSCSSFLWILLICLSLYPSPPYFLPSLYLSSTNQSNPFFKFPLVASPTKAPSSILSLTLYHNPCPQYFTPSYPTVHNRVLTSPAAPPAMITMSYITSLLCNPPYSVIFFKIHCLVASEVLPCTMSWCSSFCFVTSVFSYVLSSCKCSSIKPQAPVRLTHT